MNHTFVSVIIPTFNRENPLIQVLAAFFVQHYPHFEIIVVDQSKAHAQETLNFLKSNEGKFRYYRLTEANLPKARNFGAQKANGDILLFCDDDAVPDKDFIRFHAENYADPAIGCVTGRITERGDSRKPYIFFKRSVIGGKIALSGRYIFNWRGDKKGYTFSAPGANMSCRSGLFKAIGGFDAAFGVLAESNCEDVDFAYRIRGTGAKIIFEPKAMVIHQLYPRGGCRVNDAVESEYGRFCYVMLFYLKNMNKVFLPYMLTIFFLIGIKKILIPTRSFKNFLYVLRGLWDGFKIYLKKERKQI